MEVLDEHRAAEHLGLLQVLALILSVYVLVALFIQATVNLSPDAVEILDWIDLFVCGIFLGDFFARFHRAPSKAKFLKWRWIDFVSSIPMLNIFRVGRVVRIVRVSNLAGVSFHEISCRLLSALSKGHFFGSGRSHFLLHYGVRCNRGDEF
jgi:xanthine/uracil permease